MKRFAICLAMALALGSAASAQEKKKTHQTSSGEPAHSFATLLAHLGTQTRNTVEIAAAAEPTTFQQLTEPSPLQAEALRLLAL